MMKATKWILVKQFDGVPKSDDLKMVIFDLDDNIKDNEILLEAIYLSIDPNMRRYKRKVKLPFTMFGEQISRVIKSENPKYPIGMTVSSNAGWVSHYISGGHDLNPIPIDLGNTSISHCLGALGLPGMTAYFALEVLKPKKNEVMILNSAAGAVGHIAGQLAKIKGCTIIALVGSDEKVNLCRQLGFDYVFNYKTVVGNELSKIIKKIAPKGVELFFDNVGGSMHNTIINCHMKPQGRVLICGAISDYNNKEEKLYPSTNGAILNKNLKVQGFNVTNFQNDWITALVEIHEYIKKGRIIPIETAYKGIHLMQDAFYGLFSGLNAGKGIIKNDLDVLYL